MSEHVITARDRAIGWSRDAVLVEHASFDVHHGEIFGILGRSACGKSTLLRVLIGLEPPLAGTFTIEGAEGQEGRPGFGVMSRLLAATAAPPYTPITSPTSVSTGAISASASTRGSTR